MLREVMATLCRDMKEVRRQACGDTGESSKQRLKACGFFAGLHVLSPAPLAPGWGSCPEGGHVAGDTAASAETAGGERRRKPQRRKLAPLPVQVAVRVAARVAAPCRAELSQEVQQRGVAVGERGRGSRARSLTQTLRKINVTVLSC